LVCGEKDIHLSDVLKYGRKDREILWKKKTKRTIFFYLLYSRSRKNFDAGAINKEKNKKTNPIFFNIY
jgi:hypothetical protein